MSQFSHWEVKESERFHRECKAIIPDAKRMDEILKGVRDQIESDPDGSKIKDKDVKSSVKKVQGTANVWAAPTTNFPDAPALLVYYKINSDHVELVSILKVSEEGED
jgi:hypothetical protein